jgi:ABC-type branched-subunit amino acid transport system ATPase component
MIRDLLVDYTKNGNTVILIEHDISFISEFVEWVYLFVGGKRVTFGKIDEILSSEEVVKGIWGI